jgi:hypothetical protein
MMAVGSGMYRMFRQIRRFASTHLAALLLTSIKFYNKYPNIALYSQVN